MRKVADSDSNINGQASASTERWEETFQWPPMEVAGVRLKCECPVCARVKALVERAGHHKDVGSGIRLFVAEDLDWRPNNGAADGGPKLKQTGPPLNVSENGDDSVPGRINDEEQEVSHPQGRRLRIVNLVAWSADGGMLKVAP